MDTDKNGKVSKEEFMRDDNWRRNANAPRHRGRGLEVNYRVRRDHGLRVMPPFGVAVGLS